MSKRWVGLGLIVGALAAAGPAGAQDPGAFGPGAFGAPAAAPAGPFGPGAFGAPPPAPGPFGGGPGALAPAPGAFEGPTPPCPPDGGPPDAAVPFTVPTADEPGVPFCPCFSLALEYLTLWTKSNRLAFPVLTSGSASDPVPGAIGQPGTQVLLGTRGFGYGPTAGFRVAATYWVQPGYLALEANGFIAEQASQGLGRAVPGGPNDPVIARPFFDPNAGRENADPRAHPGALAGTISQGFTTRLFGSEANARWNLANSETDFAGASVSLLVGVRQLKLDDRFRIADQVVEQPAGTGNTFAFSDTFTTYNEFYGGQVGARIQWRWDERLVTSVQGKVAYGMNYETIKINGGTVVTDPTGRTVAGDGFGLYAQRTNIGTYRRHRTALLPELNLNTGVDLNEHIRVTAGYSLVWLNNVVRPGQQMDRVVNLQPLNLAPGMTGTSLRPAPPQFQETDFWFQFVNVGLEFTY